MNYSKKAAVSFLLLLILSVSVSALCNDTGLPATFALENARPYNDINSSFTFYAHYNDASGNVLEGNNTLVNVSFQNGTYNMTYNAATKRWYITVSSSVYDDVTFFVQGQSDTYQCRSLTFTSKWRTPFFINFEMYKQQLNTTDPGHYMNDFQYVVLLDERYKSSDDLILEAWDTGANKGMDWVLESLGGAPVATPKRHDSNIYFWGKYSNGDGRVKIYEPGNYSVYIMNNKLQHPLNTFYEFERPTMGDIEYMGNVYTHLKLYNVSNVSNTVAGFNNSVVKVSFSKWEANSYYVFMNIFVVILVALVYFGLLYGLFLLTQNSQSQGQFILTYLIIATPIALGFILYVN